MLLLPLMLQHQQALLRALKLQVQLQLRQQGL
jgi:hypothetical protein